MENIEFQYGSEEQGSKLAGVADLRFGRSPQLQRRAVRHGRLISTARFPARCRASQPPAATIRKLAELGAAAFRTTLPVQTRRRHRSGHARRKQHPELARRYQQQCRRLESRPIRIPRTWHDASTPQRPSCGRRRWRRLHRARRDRRIGPKDAGGLAGGPQRKPAGRTAANEPARRRDSRQPTRLRSNGLKLEFNRKPLTGRLAYLFRSGMRPARLDAEIRRAQFDIDAALDFGKALLAGSAWSGPAR